MKKIGILTFHFADNYGAVLQAYALRKVINSFSTCHAEIMNYVPPAFRYKKTWQNEEEEKLFFEKRAKFETFLEQHCGVISAKVNSIGDSEEYDYYVVGSDQIWNTNSIGYFLPEVSDYSKKISYAASIGVSPDAPKLRKSVLQKYVPTFSHVSVREYEHVPLIEEECHVNCECVLDPTLLLDVEDYLPLVSKEKLREDKFIFFFWLKHDSEFMRGVEFANNLARKLGLPIVHYFNFAPKHMFCNDGGDMQFESIENFLWYVKNAEYVITNSYHATIFSLMFHRPFYTFVTQSMRGRIDTLCARFGIDNRVVEKYLSIDKVNKEIDFEGIFQKVYEQRKASIHYLKNALEIVDE